jgi:protein-disulfide isomerase/uncharacterized membrane protein
MSFNQKSFYRENTLKYHIFGGLGAILMVILSIYLTNHYFAVKFPTGLGGGGLCDINAFFNCDVATHSAFSNIAGVPISLLGLLMGLFVLFGYLFNNEEIEGTIHGLLIINGVGCLILFLYSLIGLGGLCPACTMYYVASWSTLFAFFKTSDIRIPSPLPLISYGVVYGAIFFGTYQFVQGKESKTSKLAQSLITQYDGLANLGEPKNTSDYIMAGTKEGYKSAAIRITKFSDFECPACKALSDILHKVAKKYEGKIAIQYFFYPLDNNCNPAMKTPLHRYACKAAYMAACAPQKFQEVEADIFANQPSLSDEWIEKKAKELGVTECMNKKETKDKVVEYIAAAKSFNIRSTPTFLLNGVKIEGVLPESQLSILIEHILKKK